MKITREIKWVSSKEKHNLVLIERLEEKLQQFYSLNPDYYGNIEFTQHNWIDPQQHGYLAIVEASKVAKAVCEVGCGSANILKFYPTLQAKYTGCDFSKKLMERNKKLYSEANFKEIETPNLLPFKNNSFDLVYSTFVLEHSTNPSLFLQECARILKPNGRLIILCPDFLAQGKFTSQRAGFSAGTTSQKIKASKFFDAIITFFDNRIRIPFYCKFYKAKAKRSPQFMINLQPVLFEDSFIPDVDAVYVTYKNEIIMELGKKFSVSENSKELRAYEYRHKLIFLSLNKCVNE